MPKDDSGSGFAEIEEYTKKLTQNPESLVFVSLAEAYRKSGMLDEAIETCLKGLQVHPSYMSARMVLGRAYQEKEMLEEAATEFSKVAAADVNNIMAHSLLGQVHIKQGKFAGAIDDFQKVLSLNPEDVGAQQFLKQALERAKQDGPGREDKKGSAPDTKKEISQAEAFTKQGDIDNALKVYRLILEADPENLVVRQRLRDLELRKAQTPAGKGADKGRGDALGSHRDNDKITSDDILSVMKDTIPKGPERAKSQPAKADAPDADKPKAAGKSQVSPEISAALAKLMQTTGIVGSLLIDDQGRFLDSTFVHQDNLADLAKTALLMFEKTGKAVQAMNYGTQIKQIMVTGERGQIFFNRFGARLLMIQADENVNIGQMRLAMNDVNKVLR